MTASTPGQLRASATEHAVAMLEALAAELDGLGLSCRLVIQAGRVPVLHVTSPAAARLSEDIRVAPAGGPWRYFWSWHEPIAADPGEAAALISRVLRTAAPPGTAAPPP